MQFILTIMLTLTLGLSLLQCQKSTTSGKPETAKNNTDIANTSDAQANMQIVTATPVVASADDAPRISLEDAKKAFDAGNAIIVDTRAEVAYKTEHIKGAINIPAEAFQTRYKEVPKDKKIIAYCSWPAEHTSARAVQILKQNGYDNAYALFGGTAAWKNAGYPMEQGEQK